MEKENNQITDVIDSSQLDKQDILIIKVIVFIMLSILVGITFWNTGSLLSFLPYIPTIPYIMMPDDFWR
jgi:hypothetical protein